MTSSLRTHVTNTTNPEEPSGKIPSSDDGAAKHTIQRIMDHEPQEDGTHSYLIRCYGYTADDDTLELIGHLPRSKVVQYFKSKMLPMPPDIFKARVC